MRANPAKDLNRPKASRLKPKLCQSTIKSTPINAAIKLNNTRVGTAGGFWTRINFGLSTDTKQKYRMLAICSRMRKIKPIIPVFDGCFK